MDDTAKLKQCKTDIGIARRFREEIPPIVDELVSSCNREDCFDHIGPEPIPSREAIIDILQRASRILYPGYFIHTRVDEVNAGYYFGQEITGLFEALSEQIMLAIRHDCIRHDLPCTGCEERGQEAAIDFLRGMPELRRLLATDIIAAHEGDPAAQSFDEIIFSYPGLYAITVYRIAHQLRHQEIPLIPRIMTEYAHSKTGIDIHPGAHIGERFFID
ncbi:MAG: serine acetyltransferase, partial [Syntrophaceae bacterium]|nr:serine acetyltransferase [Syntrophaceae bacterium]